MEIKKTIKTDLQNKRFLFYQLGLFITLVAIYGLFHLNSNKAEVPVIQTRDVEVISEILPVAYPEDPQTPQPTRVVAPTISDRIEIVENFVELESTDIFNPETDDKTPVYTGLETGIPRDGTTEAIEEAPFIKAEVDPNFQGAGVKSQDMFRLWVQQNVKYPRIAEENNVTGVVILKFVIGKDGRIGDINVLSSPDRALTDEVIRVLNSSPAWAPGMQRNRPVAVYGTIRIVFAI